MCNELFSVMAALQLPIVISSPGSVELLQADLLHSAALTR